MVSPRGTSVVVSWLDTFAETVEVISWVVDFMVTVVMVFVLVNPEAGKKQGGQVRT